MSFSIRGRTGVAWSLQGTNVPATVARRARGTRHLAWGTCLVALGCSAESAPIQGTSDAGAAADSAPITPDASSVDTTPFDAAMPEGSFSDASPFDADRDAPLSDRAPDVREGDVSVDGDAGPSNADASDGRTNLDASLSDAADASSSDASRDAPSDATSSDAGAPDATMRCNGYAELCDRRFDEVVFPSSHNAMSNSDDGWIAPNQQHGIKRQLEDGIRGMLIDTYSYMGTTYLCHTSCALGNRRFADALGDMKTFLQSNPHEVLTLVIENHVTAAETETAFTASGLVDLVYVHPAGAAWPTLRTMIESGHRVVVGSETDEPPPAWYHDFYTLAWDTPYSFKSTSDFSCQENRGTRANALFLLNHWVENPLPDENLSRTANARDVLLNRARQCRMESGKLPNFVAVSHYAVGDLFAVVRELNGL